MSRSRNNSIMVALVAFVTASVEGSTPDVLDLVRDSAVRSIPLQYDYGDEDESIGGYLVVRAGVALLDDPTAESIQFKSGSNFGLQNALNGPNIRMTEGRLEDVDFVAGTGYDFTFGIGIKLSEEVTVEVQTGVQWNPIESASANLSYLVEEQVPGGDPIERSYSSPAIGGQGDIYQVPLVANLLYDVEVMKDLRLAIGAGAGVQWTQFTSRNITSTEYPGVIYYDQISQQEQLLPLIMNLEGQAISARFQLRAGLSWQVIPRGFLGAYVQFSQSSLVNIGGLGFDENANNIYRDGGEIRVPYLRSLSIGGRFSYTF